MELKLRITLSTIGLECIARGEERYLSVYHFNFASLTGDEGPGEGVYTDVEISLPSRDKAVELALSALRAEAHTTAKQYEERFQKLIALTWSA